MGITFLVISGKDQLDRFIEKIQKEAEVTQMEIQQISLQQEETNKLLTEQKVFYGLYQEMPLLDFSSFLLTVTGRTRLIRSHSLARIFFEISGNTN